MTLKTFFIQARQSVSAWLKRRRLNSFCARVHCAGYTCLPCGTLIWDGTKALNELKDSYGEEKLRKLCVEAVFRNGADAGCGTPGKGADLPYRLLSQLRSEELIGELIALWKRETQGRTESAPGSPVRLRRLEILISVLCKRKRCDAPAVIIEPTADEQMALLPEYSYG